MAIRQILRCFARLLLLDFSPDTRRLLETGARAHVTIKGPDKTELRTVPGGDEDK